MGEVPRAKTHRLQITGRGLQYGIAIVVLLIVVILSISVFILLRKNEHERIVRDFNRASQDRLFAVKNTLRFDLLTLQVIRSFFDGSSEVEREEFRVFVEPLLKSHPSIQALEWVPRVPKNERGKFYETAARYGYQNFTIYESNVKTKKSRSPRGDDCFPVFFAEPALNNAKVVGCDLASIPACLKAMNTACETSHCAMTSEISPRGIGDDRASIRVFLPVYRKKVPLDSVEERRENLDGYIVGTFNPKGIIRESLSSLTKVGIDIQLLDTSRPDQQISIYAYGALPQQPKPLLNEEAASQDSELRTSEEFEVAQRQWTVACAATPLFIESRMTWYPWIVAVGVFLLTGLLDAYLLAIAEQNAKTNRLADQLTLANRHLEKEIADRKQAEAMSWSSEVKYKTLYDASADAILLLTPQGEFLNGNHAAAMMFGCKNDSDFILLSPVDLSPEYQPDGSRSVEKAIHLIDIAMREGSHHFEWIHRRIDGREFLASITLTRMEFEENVLLLTTLRDITEQRRYDDALRNSENRYRQLFDQNADAIFIADVESRAFVDCNKKAELLTGYSRQEILALRADQLYPRDIRAEAMNGLLAQAEGTLQTSLATTVQNKMGKIIPVLISAGPVDIADKQYVMGVFADISEQKQAEAKQVELIQRLEGVNRLQEELLLPGTLTEKLQKVTDAAVALLDLDFCRIWRIEPGERCSEGCPHANNHESCRTSSSPNQCLHLIVSSGRYTHIDGNHSRVPLDSCNLGRIAGGEEGKFITNDATADPRISDHEWATNLGLVSFAGYKLRDTDGRPIGVLALFAKHAIDNEEDIFLANLADATSRVIVDGKAEEMLRDAERRLRLVVENVSDVIWTVDSSGRFTYVTPSSEKWLGYTSEEMLQLTAVDVTTPASGALATEKLMNLFAQSQNKSHPLPEIIELEIVRRDGTNVWGEITFGGMYDETGKMIAAQGVCRDISDRKAMEHERFMTAKRMESLLALNHMFDKPMEEIIATVVEDAIRLTGSQIGYLALMNEDENVLTMHYWSKSAHAMCQVLDQPVVYPLETTGLWGEAVRQRKPVMTNDYAAPSPLKRGIPEGHVPIVRHMNIPVFEGNRIVAVAGVGNKTTDYEQRDLGQLQLLMEGWWRIVMHKRFEEQLVEARQQAELANTAKSRFLAAMSHEIRTPMTAILGYADMLMDPTIGASNRNNYLVTIRRSGEHLLALINDILDLSKIEAGKMILDIGRCNIVSLLADVASVVRPKAKSHGVSFSIEYAGEIPETILTDGVRLRQTIINLAGNAVKFTEKGSVRIVVSRCELSGDQPAIKFEVIDTGIGIREEVLPILFQPFCQGDMTVARKYGGTGLGLVISHYLANMLGGDLTATSVWEQGSTFTLTVPTGSLEGVRLLQSPVEAEHETAGHVWRSTPEELRGVRILLAEDGYDNRELIQAILCRAGAEVKIAENGHVAIEQVNNDRFDVILMDMNMPEMDGYEATSLLRSRGYEGPILALTANAMSEDRERCRFAGCNEYLTKPIDRVLLIKTIAAFSGRDATLETTMPLPSAENPVDENEMMISEYIDDPEMTEIIREFVGRLAGYRDAMHQACEAKNFEELRKEAHKLKGAGGSYGYPALTEACRILEDAAKTQDDVAAGQQMDIVSTLIQAIENGCRESVSTGAQT